MIKSLSLAQHAAEAANSKKAYDILILDLRGLTYLTDFFVICSASNITQVQAITEGIEEALAQDGIRPSHIEGQAETTWVLMDYSDFVVHVFEEQTRLYYSLEKLWGDAPRMPLVSGRHSVHGASS